jgi:hypothetical protein
MKKKVKNDGEHSGVSDFSGVYSTNIISPNTFRGTNNTYIMERSQNSFCVCVAQKLSLNSTQNTENLAKPVTNL